jgi:2-oxoglutarate ferredoxin oxidoreductase subunit alpha
MGTPAKNIQSLDTVVIRFAGDSGDGMQLTGSQFTTSSAIAGNDLATLPDYPAEIRAPAGSLAGVSGFQIQFSSHEVLTPGDAPDVLVAMNPAALQRNLKDVRAGGTIILDEGTFDARSLKQAGFAADPRGNGALAGYQVFEVPLENMTVTALKDLDISPKEARRSKNLFALGLMYWMFDRPFETTIDYLERKFSRRPEILEANMIALKAGFAFGETTEMFATKYQVPRALIEPGFYRNIAGNEALAVGFVAAAHKAGLPLFLGSYPITPASTILHELSKYKEFGVFTFQAEDEIAAITSAIGAAFAGALALTTSSGPGIALKGEGIGLAVMTELPVVIVNVQRGGPSTGLPTKTEQADLLQAMWGRNGEAPVPIISASTPADCFDVAFEAIRIATRYMTPVFVLSDGYIATGAEPWKVPDAESLPSIEVAFREDPEGFKPYARDERNARPWVRPGTPGLEHRIGGLEKEHLTGAVSYSTTNHEHMVKLRAKKIAGIADEYPKTVVDGPESGDLLVVGWGSTYGAIRVATQRARAQGLSVAHLQLRYLNPLPKDLGEVLSRYRKVLVPEMNLGQLSLILRAEYLLDCVPLNKVQGLPFRVDEVERKIHELIEGC